MKKERSDALPSLPSSLSIPTQIYDRKYKIESNAFESHILLDMYSNTYPVILINIKTTRCFLQLKRHEKI